MILVVKVKTKLSTQRIGQFLYVGDEANFTWRWAETGPHTPEIYLTSILAIDLTLNILRNLNDLFFQVPPTKLSIRNNEQPSTLTRITTIAFNTSSLDGA